jgi:cytochrome b6-f complex iron-sulfur subunit
VTTQGASSSGISKKRARSGLSRLQAFMGILLIAAAGNGVYLLGTDASLWLLALSHAVGLVLIVIIDLGLAVLNLVGSRRAYLPTIAASLMAIVLQVGDIATAPQYNQTVEHFARYLFGLWAFDLLLVLQSTVLLLSLLGRPYARYLARLKSRKGAELDYSRRSFLRSMTSLAGLIGIAVVLSSIKLPVSSSLSTVTKTTGAGVPAGAVAKMSDLKVNTPVYFEYPSGHPNMLVLKSDGTMNAVSILCTHVCCECEYIQSSKVLSCPCHGSLFSIDGTLLRGPANADLPTILFTTDQNGYIIPTGVSSPGPCEV